MIALVVFNFIRNNFVKLYCDSCHISVHLKKNPSKLVNFCVVILISKMEVCNISRKVKTQLRCNKRFVQCMEKVLWLIKHVKSGLWSFVLEISCWMVIHGWVDQLKLRVIKLKHWELSTLYYVEDSRHTQNIQINKVVGENEKCVFYFTEEIKWTFWPTLLLLGL